MIVTVRFESSLRDIAGMCSLEVDIPERSSLRSLLMLLQDRFGAGIMGGSNEYAWRHASTHVLVLKNGEQVRNDDDPVGLVDGDIITMLPPLAGG